MKQTIAATAALLFVATPALAQDYPPIWSGLYVGIHGGWASGDVNLDLSHTTGAIIYGDPFDPPHRSLTGSDAGMAGVQVGASHQMGRLILGIEADASWTDLDATGTFATTDAGPCAPNACTQWQVDTSLEAMGTIRGRLGILLKPTLLLYGTGGLAWGLTDTTQVSHHNGPNFPDAGGVVSGDSQHIGWTAGGGLEWRLSPRWSIKGEYLYVDLGEAGTQLTGTVSPTSTTPWAESFKQDLELHTVRAGLNFHFGGDDYEAVPLK
jgi:outer membrane immunogenic protein